MSLVVMALREVPGIARLGSIPGAPKNARGQAVDLQIDRETVSANCYLIAQAGTNLLDLGMAAQATVAAIIGGLAGMTIGELNIYIQDVEAGHA